MRGPRGQVRASLIGQTLQRLAHLRVYLGRPAGTLGIQQRGDTGALGQAARLPAPAAYGGGCDADFGCRSGIGFAARAAGGPQLFGVADGGEPRAGALAFGIAGAFPRRHICQYLACLGVVIDAGLGVEDGGLRRGRARGARLPRGCFVNAAEAPGAAHRLRIRAAAINTRSIETRSRWSATSWSSRIAFG